MDECENTSINGWMWELHLLCRQRRRYHPSYRAGIGPRKGGALAGRSWRDTPAYDAKEHLEKLAKKTVKTGKSIRMDASFWKFAVAQSALDTYERLGSDAKSEFSSTDGIESLSSQPEIATAIQEVEATSPTMMAKVCCNAVANANFSGKGYAFLFCQWQFLLLR